jgi:hypothetical protein
MIALSDIIPRKQSRRAFALGALVFVAVVGAAGVVLEQDAGDLSVDNEVIETGPVTNATTDASGDETPTLQPRPEPEPTPGPESTPPEPPDPVPPVEPPTEFQQRPPGNGISGSLSPVDANLTVVGTAANDTAGWSVAGVGDVNGDGHADVIVGVPRRDTRGRNDTGAAYVFYGPFDDAQFVVDDADVRLQGSDAFELAGWSVAGAGDLNGDGYDDVLVGAPFNDGNGMQSGAVYVVYGGPNLSSNRSLATANATLYGDPGQYAGWSVDETGAMEGQDTGVVVGAPRADVNGNESGVVYLYGASNLTGEVILDLDANATFDGRSAGDRLGWSVAGVGDVNGDGTDDVLVGAIGSDANGNQSGSVYLVHGTVFGQFPLRLADARIDGRASGDRFGWSVAGGGDVDGDGVDDFAVGAPFDDLETTNAGAAYVFAANGSANYTLRNADVTLTGENVSDNAGRSVAVGDVSCDGTADVLVGAPFNDSGGVTYVVTGGGNVSGTVSLGGAAATFVGLSGGDRTGYAVGTVAGPNGTRGFVVGAPNNDAAYTNSGAAYARTTNCPGLPTDTETDSGTDDSNETAEMEGAAVDVRCLDTRGSLTVTNRNEASVTVAVTGTGFADSVAVPANESRTITALDAGTYTVETRSNGSAVAADSVPVDCGSTVTTTPTPTGTTTLPGTPTPTETATTAGGSDGPPAEQLPTVADEEAHENAAVGDDDDESEDDEADSDDEEESDDDEDDDDDADDDDEEESDDDDEDDDDDDD